MHVIVHVHYYACNIKIYKKRYFFYLYSFGQKLILFLITFKKKHSIFAQKNVSKKSLFVDFDLLNDKIIKKFVENTLKSKQKI